MSQDRVDVSQSNSGEPSALFEPGRLALLALAVLGAFEVGRLAAGALIGPWLSEVLLGTRKPVVVGEFDLARFGIEVLSIAIGTMVAALIAVPVVKILSRR